MLLHRDGGEMFRGTSHTHLVSLCSCSPEPIFSLLTASSPLPPTLTSLSLMRVGILPVGKILRGDQDFYICLSLCEQFITCVNVRWLGKMRVKPTSSGVSERSMTVADYIEGHLNLVGFTRRADRLIERGSLRPSRAVQPLNKRQHLYLSGR